MSPLPKIDLSVLLKLPVWQRLLILGALWVVIAGAFYYFIYSAKMAESTALGTKLERLKEDVAKKQKMADNLPKFREEMVELNKQLTDALAALPNEKEIANLLDNISDAARSSRLTILTFKPGRETPKEFYAEVTIDMKVEGSYSSMLAFFNKVADMPRIVNINLLNIGTGKEVKGEVMLTATFVAITFKFLPQP